MPKRTTRSDPARRSSKPAPPVGGGPRYPKLRRPELIGSIPAVVWTADVKTLQFTFVSRHAETLLGYSIARWINEPLFWQDHVYPKDKFVITERANAVKDAGRYDLEYRMVAADGRAVWVRDLGHIVGEGEDRHLAGIIVDLSAKRARQGGLGEDKIWLRGIIDTIPQQIWSGPADGTLDFCNARWRTELGLTLAELKGDGWQRMIHPDDRDRVLKAWLHSVATGEPYQMEERHRMAGGAYRWFLSRGVPLRDEQGRVVRWYGTNTDIEEQKRAEDELRRQEQLWRAVFDNAYVGVAITDCSERFVAVNAAYEKLVGYSLEELRGMTCLDVTHGEDRNAYHLLQSELTSGTRDRFETEKRYIHKDGRVVWVRANGSVLPSLSGEPCLHVVVVEDITERKRLQADLERQVEQLRALLNLTHQLITKLDVRSVIESVLAVLHDYEMSRPQGEQWEFVAILLPEPSGDTLKEIYRHRGAQQPLESTIPIEGSISGRVYRSGQRIVYRAEELPRLSAEYGLAPWVKDVIDATGVQVGCFLPLIYAGQTIGVLVLGNSEDRKLPPSYLDYLQEVAQFVAASLDHALRFDTLSASQERLASERTYTDEQIRAIFDFEHIVGRSKAMQAVLQQVQTVAPTDSAVLILGETGTGKELIARAIHDRSRRKDQPFIKVDCAAIPAALLESELFGHEKGAFTGAVGHRVGRLEIADHGTLFLDEIGDLPLELQTKLLRVLQDQAFERLGSNRTIHLDLRVIAATNRNLDEMVGKGEFRADLYYRLKVFPILVPPVRERPDDIPPLVWHYVHKYAHRLKRPIDTIPAEAMQAFKQYPWPGNVRELQHFMERSVVLTSGNVLQAPLGELERVIRRREARGNRPGGAGTMEEIERESILNALRESNWVVGGPHGAARKLGLKRTTLASRMERLGISRPR